MYACWLCCVVGDGFGVGLSKKLQKWSKGKQEEKVNNMVLFDKATYDKLLCEAPTYKLITPSILSDRLSVIRFPCFRTFHSSYGLKGRRKFTHAESSSTSTSSISFIQYSENETLRFGFPTQLDKVD